MKKAYQVKFKDLQNDDLSQCYTPYFTKREAIQKANKLVEYHLGLCEDDTIRCLVNAGSSSDYSVYCANYFDVSVESVDISSLT